MIYRWTMIAKTLLLAGILLDLSAPVPALASETPRKRSGTVTVNVKMATPPAARDVRVWIPYPASDKNQTISDIHVSGNFTSQSVQKDPATGSFILYAEWKGSSASERNLTYTFTAKRLEVLNRTLRDGGASVPEAGSNKFLDLSWLGQTEQKIRQHAAEITQGRTTDLAKARAVYAWVVDNMRRDPDAKACGLCEVEHLLSARMGKCADVHTVFVALLRASGVPARDIWGIRMPKEKTADMTKKQHCWAEFYLPDCGWVPVDAGDVHKIVHDRKLTAVEAKKLPEREYFFGNIDEDRIQLGYVHRKLTPAQKGKDLVYFMYPYAEADGRQIGEDVNHNFGYTITFREL